MIIDGNEIEKKAMAEFRIGNREKGLAIQDQFVAEFRKEFQKKDHCSCQKACKYHGKCKECVAIHRAHKDHLPNCFHPMVNQKLTPLLALTERETTK